MVSSLGLKLQNLIFGSFYEFRTMAKFICLNGRDNGSKTMS